MQLPIQYCSVCDGIALHWNKCTQEWTARYVDGGHYCSCPNDEMPKCKKATKEWQI